jgi:hypothetical protein
LLSDYDISIGRDIKVFSSDTANTGNNKLWPIDKTTDGVANIIDSKIRRLFLDDEG